MQRALILALLATTFACSATDQTAVETALQTPGVPEGQEARDAVVLGTLDWRGEQITFHDISGPGDTVPAILTTYYGPGGQPELSVVADQQARFEPTPAEIWRAVAGDREIPDELLAQHAWQVADEGRPDAFQDFYLERVEVEKALPNFSTMFPLTTTGTGLADPSFRCWNDGGLRRFTEQKAVSMCSANGNFARLGFDIATSPCSPVLNVNETLRTGAYKQMGGGYFSKTCGATGNPGTWSCTSVVSMLSGMYFASTLAKNGSAHRMGTGSFTPGTLAPIPEGFLGSAILKVGVPSFENTSCNGFSANF